MKPTITPPMRKVINDYIVSYNRAMKKKEGRSKYTMSIKEVASTISYLSQNSKQSYSEIYKYLNDDLLLSCLGVASIS